MSNFFYPILGISTGDPNGIGIEVILKSLEKIRNVYMGSLDILINYLIEILILIKYRTTISSQ